MNLEALKRPEVFTLAILAGLLEVVVVLWLLWRRRARERATLALVEQIVTLSAEMAALRTAVDAMGVQVVALRAALDAMRGELDSFVHGPPSLRGSTLKRGPR